MPQKFEITTEKKKLEEKKPAQHKAPHRERPSSNAEDRMKTRKREVTGMTSVEER